MIIQLTCEEKAVVREQYAAALADPASAESAAALGMSVHEIAVLDTASSSMLVEGRITKKINMATVESVVRHD